MFERYEGGEKALLVHVFFPKGSTEKDLSEVGVLVASAQIDILSTIITSRNAPAAKYFVGTGKAQEIADAVKEHGASTVLFNHTLTPAQERNVEALCQCQVVDRTGFILDIFAKRAHTHEGKLQVELACGREGPGETQLETDRRLLRKRIQFILSRLTKVEKQRDQGRQARAKADIPTLLVMNKIDLLDNTAPRIDRNAEGKPIRVWLSARASLGRELLCQALKELLARQIKRCQLSLPSHMTKLRSRFYQLNAVDTEAINDDGSFNLQIRIPFIEWNKLCKQEHNLLELVRKNATN